MELSKDYIFSIVRDALSEDIGEGDITTNSIVPSGIKVRGEFLAKSNGVICGLSFAETAFRVLEENIKFIPNINDGDDVTVGHIIATVEGEARAILSAERTALNFLTHLSGIATLTRKFVDAVSGTKTKILDTRKTTPLLRLAEKYATYCGGAQNHRIGLYDMILVKDNHIAIAGGIKNALDKIYSSGKPKVPVEVEVTDLEQLETALLYPVDRIMLDNFSVEKVREAIKLRDKLGRNIPFECSGGITLENIRAYAETGVEYISIGAITHSAQALDISLEIS